MACESVPSLGEGLKQPCGRQGDWIVASDCLKEGYVLVSKHRPQPVAAFGEESGAGVPEMELSDLLPLAAQVPGWLELCAALQQRRSGTISGAWGSSAAWAAAALQTATGAVQLLVIPHGGELESWVEELAAFAGRRPLSFPGWEDWSVPVRRSLRDPVAAARWRTLEQLSQYSEGSAPTSPLQVVAPIAALLQPVPPRQNIQQHGLVLSAGQTFGPQELAEWLVQNGYKRVEVVEYPGEFARRGGICDLFPVHAELPVRIEWFGDEIESIRSFAVESQRSLHAQTNVRLLPVAQDGAVATAPTGFFTEYLTESAHVAIYEPEEVREQARLFFERVIDRTGLFTPEATWSALLQLPNVTISTFPRPGLEAVVHLHAESVERFSGQWQRVREELDAVAADAGRQVVVVCPTEGESRRLAELLQEGQLARSGRLRLARGYVREGFRLVEAGVIVLGSQQLFQRDAAAAGPGRSAASSRTVESRPIDSFLDLNEGDYVVHVVHGIAIYRGMRLLPKYAEGTVAPAASDGPPVASDVTTPASSANPSSLSNPPRLSNTPHFPLLAGSAPDDVAANGTVPGAYEEHLLLEFRDNELLYVPASRIDLVQKYVGGRQAAPPLSKLGSATWGRRKARAAEAARDLAAELLRIQAVRQTVPAYAFPPDSEWQRDFEAAFGYVETPDQLAAIREVKADLEKPRPMDRLLCGDVGFGKTEVALRAAFKVIDNGKQVAVLVPTTILAEQHYRTFQQRLAEYPFVVEVLSRFQSPAEQREILQRLAAGGVDVIIGTHRLLSKDVHFKDLGLVIIDEEQRFGVEHKERLKQLRATVHVLTMTATPIPRTLHAALLGLRDISNLTTPPPERLPIETRIIIWEEPLIRRAILREMNRGGQVFFVHNRVHDIEEVARRLRELVPEARIGVAHGQQSAELLERTVVAFVRRELDVLVATTIIESGVDIPNANTIFVDDADTFGLADLHQLRGRVGRQKLRAYAYFIVDPCKSITPDARRRLKAIEEFTELGAGFKIALRDLEIRGAGNILGAEQSGHIAAVGYELYCQLLENAIRSLKHLPPQEAVEVYLHLPWPAYLPRDYVVSQKLRIEFYRRLARLRTLEQLDDFVRETRDRHGPLPPEVEWLMRTTESRLRCVPWGIVSIHRDRSDLVLTYRNRPKAEQLAAMSRGRIKLVDERLLYLRLREGEDDPVRMYRLLRRLLPVPASASPQVAAASPG